MTGFALAAQLQASSCLQALWEDGALCDCTLCPAGASVEHGLQAHRVVLAAASPYCRALLSGLWGEHQALTCVIDLPTLPADSVLTVLTAVYSGRLQVTEDAVQSVLAAANFLGVQPVVEACCQFLQDHMGPATCLRILALAARHGCHKLSAQALNYACAEFRHISVEDVVELPAELLLELLGSEALEVPAEGEVLAAALRWLEADPAGRLPLLERLLSTARLPPALAKQKVEEGEVRLDDQQCRAAVLRELEKAQVVRPSGSGGRRQSRPTGLIAAGGHDSSWQSLRVTEIYDPVQDSWEVGPMLPTAFSFAGGAATRDGVFVVGGASHSVSVAQLDRQKRVWQTLPPPAISRVHCAVAGLPGELYVLGGRHGASDVLKSVVCLPSGGTGWTAVPDMKLARTSLAAAAIDGHVYAIGGQAGKEVFSSAEALDVGSGRWTSAGHMHTERKYTSAAVLHGRIHVVGGMTAQRNRLASMEAFDPREGIWEKLPDMAAMRSSCGFAAFEDALYAVAGAMRDDLQHETVECYEPAAGRWRPCTSLGFGRSNLALAPL